MKFFKKKNLLNVLYAVLIALPLFSILGRVLYTQWNQNAKDSYYGDTINQTSLNTLNSINDLNNEDLYNFYAVQNGTFTGPTGNITIYINDFVDLDNLGLSQIPNNFLYYYLNSNDIAIQFRYNSTIILSPSTSTKTLNFNFRYVSSSSNGLPLTDILNYTKEIEYNNYSFLDNAFDYSISQFVSENDFGKLNFFTWFSDLFLSNNSVNNLYIHFVNWYLNYTLYVSLGYILWLVLMWFVSFIRRLLEKTSTYETGGF